MEKIPIIIDCDPGHDDAIALILAFAREELDVKAVTVCAGNQTLEKTMRNAKKILSFIGKRVPVAAGASKPICRPLAIAPEVHGESGLDGPSLPEADFTEEAIPAMELLRKTILESPKPITLIPTGPLTNIGLLFTVYPEVKQNIERISLMGGGIETGNWTSAAEFNIFVDPEAADIVFRSGLPIIMSGLDLTHKALFFQNEIDELRSFGGKIPVLVAELMDFYSQYHKNQGLEGTPLHDPCAVAYIIKPEIFVTQPFHITIECQGKYSSGMTLADRRPWSNAQPNVTACLDLDRKEFIKLIFQACKSYPG